MRRRAPQEDFISLLMSQEVDGHRLTNDDILDIGYLFFIAGLDTVTCSLDCMLAYLAQSVLLSTPLGAQVMTVTLASLTVLTILLRLAARTVARRLSPPERCLLVGETLLWRTRIRARASRRALFAVAAACHSEPPDVLSVYQLPRTSGRSATCAAQTSASPA